MKCGSITLVLSLLTIPMMTLAADIPRGWFRRHVEMRSGQVQVRRAHAPE